MANLIEQAITRYHGDHPAKTIQEALRQDRKPGISEDVANRPRAACAHHHSKEVGKTILSHHT
jgi:hypothetical protein